MADEDIAPMLLSAEPVSKALSKTELIYPSRLATKSVVRKAHTLPPSPEAAVKISFRIKRGDSISTSPPGSASIPLGKSDKNSSINLSTLLYPLISFKNIVILKIILVILCVFLVESAS